MSEPTVKLDEEGLLEHYDVVLCGTGLVQSIVASAVARCKKSVLHVDGADYYGGLEAVWTLPYLLSLKEQQVVHQSEDEETGSPPSSLVSLKEDRNHTVLTLHPNGPMQSLHFHSIDRRTQFPLKVGSAVQTLYGKGTVTALVPTSTLSNMATVAIELKGWALANGTRPTLFAGSVPVQHDEDDDCIDSQHLWQHYGIRTIAAAAAEAILDRHSRSLALDVTPYLLYASGPAVDGLLTSSVSDYVEFKSVEGLLFAEKQQRDTDGIAVSLSRVPCSKNDVFASKLLSPMDKHRLMKFLQTVGDYASAEALKAQEQLETEEAVDEVHHVNERQLKQGRSLQRPQNKAVASADLQRLQDFCQSPLQISFEAYLRDHQKLPVPLSNLVRYALALDTADCSDSGSTTRTTATNTTTVAAGIRQLCAHMMALGQFGGTAFLVPLYGSGELAQAFCRSAAVYGATYLLRREPLGIVLSKGMDDDEDDTSNNQARGPSCVRDIVLNGPAAGLLPDDSPETSTTPQPNKRIACSHVVVPRGSIYSSQSGTSHQRVVRRISILSGKPLQAAGGSQQQQQRHVVIFPPGTVSDRQTSTVHALLLDESVNVAPHVPGGCTVAHFTTTALASDTTDVGHVVLKDALDSIIASTEQPSTVEEVFHTSFSYDLWSNESDSDGTWSDVDGLHVMNRPRPRLSADEAFDQAAAIFAKICPGQDFLKLSKEMGDAVKASLGEHAFDVEDEEKTVLDSAVADL